MPPVYEHIQNLVPDLKQNDLIKYTCIGISF